MVIERKVFYVDGVKYHILWERNNTPAVTDWHPDRWRALPDGGEYEFDEIFFRGDKDMPNAEKTWHIRYGLHVKKNGAYLKNGKFATFETWLREQDEEAFWKIMWRNHLRVNVEFDTFEEWRRKQKAAV